MYSFEEQKIQTNFQKLTEYSIRRTYILSQSLRTGDPWLRAVLEADRFGKEPWDMYCFIHGLPTRNPGSWLPSTDASGRVMCGNERCEGLRTIWDAAWQRCKGVKWQQRQATECSTCKEER